MARAKSDFTMEMETKRFNRAVNRFAKKANVSTEVVIKKIAFDLLSLILTGLPPSSDVSIPNASSVTGKHPVDTGRARAGWFASVEGLGKSFNFDSGVNTDSNGVSVGKKEGRFVDKTKARLNKWVELINIVKYIIFLEYGYSKQAPAGMVRISMRKMRGKMPKTLGKKFLKEWNKIF